MHTPSHGYNRNFGNSFETKSNNNNNNEFYKWEKQEKRKLFTLSIFVFLSTVLFSYRPRKKPLFLRARPTQIFSFCRFLFVSFLFLSLSLSISLSLSLSPSLSLSLSLSLFIFFQNLVKLAVFWPKSKHFSWKFLKISQNIFPKNFYAKIVKSLFFIYLFMYSFIYLFIYLDLDWLWPETFCTISQLIRDYFTTMEHFFQIIGYNHSKIDVLLHTWSMTRNTQTKNHIYHSLCN